MLTDKRTNQPTKQPTQELSNQQRRRIAVHPGGSNEEVGLQIGHTYITMSSFVCQPVVVLCTKTRLSGFDPRNSLTASLFSRHISLHRSRNHRSGCLSCSSINLQNSSSSSFHLFIFETRDMSKSIQIKAGTTRQETALTVALGIHINTSRPIKHYSNKAKHTIYEKHK